jgi:hypothetical protein
VAEQVELGEVLVDAHGIEGAEHGDAACEADPLRLAGDGGEHDGR